MRAMGCRRLMVAALVAAWSGPAAVGAEPVGAEPVGAAPVGAIPLGPEPLRVDPWLDGAIAAGAGAGWAGVHLLTPAMMHTRCPCTRDQVNALDRVAVGLDFAAGERAADATLAVALAGSLSLAAGLAPPDRAVDDALLVVQSAALAGLTTAALKAAIARPYPYMYGPAPYPEQNDDGVNYASFPSGHTAVPMAAAVAVARVIDLRRPRSGWRWVAWTVGPALALLAGGLQVSASNHFPTDVLGGAALGAGIGLGNVWLHQR